MSARSLLLPILSLLAAMLSIQAGAAIAKTLFVTLGAEGTTALRLLLATVLLLCVYRPWRNAAWLRGPRALRMLLLYGVTLGLMNLLFYVALRGIPLGVVVAIEFLGPLTVAIATSRRAVDFLWIVLAVAGLLLLLPLPGTTTHLDPWSLAAALGAGACWGLYIVFGQRLGTYARGGAGQSVALGMIIASSVALPAGVITAGSALLEVHVLPAALLVAVLSSAIPYPLEMAAMQRMPTRTFGILMSMEPALAALSGMLLLAERLTALQWVAIASVMLASAGTALTAREEIRTH